MNIDSSLLVYCSIFIYFFNAVFLFTSNGVFRHKKNVIPPITYTAYGITTFLAIFSFILRWIESNHIPLANNYETLLLFILIANVSYYFWRKADTKKVFLAFFSLLLSMICAAASMLKTAPQDLPPALQNSWLTFHVLTCIIAYVLFTVAFVAACLYCIKKDSKENFQLLIYKSILLAVPFLTLGIVSGAIWADHAWGRYWSWDPKETWALLCWLYYILILHLRFKKIAQPKTIAVLAIIGFFVVIFTFFGVNYFLGGLHSYV